MNKYVSYHPTPGYCSFSPRSALCWVLSGGVVRDSDGLQRQSPNLKVAGSILHAISYANLDFYMYQGKLLSYHVYVVQDVRNPLSVG